MAENKIQTRISLKYDTYANWQTKNPVLLKGELAIATLAADLAQEVNNITKQPILFKVGDGTSTFNQLPWASALAADVYAWAKAKDVVRNGKVLQFKDDKGTVVHSVTFDYLTQTEVDQRVTAVTGALTSLTTSAKGTLVAAINEHDTEIGTLTSLTTTAKTNLVGAINEHDTEIGDLSKLNTKNKTSLVNAVNEALQAVETGGTGSIVTITKDTTTANTDTYTVTQGGKAVGDKVTVGTADLTVEATGALSGSGTFNANANTDKTITITHNDSGVTAGQYGADDAVSVGAGETKTINVPSVTVDAQGHVTAAADKVLSISVPALPTNHVTTDTEQDITADKIFTGGAQVAILADNGVGGNLDTILEAGQITLGDGEGASVTINTQSISTNGGTLHFPGNYNNEPYDTTIATLDDVRKIAAGAVDYRGTVSSQDDLNYLADYDRSEIELGYGDFVRVATAFGTYHAGDLLIYENDGNWTVIHGEEGDITKVTAGNGLTGGGSVGEVTVSHGAKPTTGSKQTATAGSGRTYITQIDVDTFGHIAKVYTASESDQDLSGYKTKQTAVADKITDAAHVLDSLTQNANGEISYTVKKLTPADIGAKAVQTAVSDPTASGKSLTFIDTISQNTQGVITATKKNVNLDAYALKTDIPSGTGTAGIASVANDIVTIKGNATLTGHTLANGTAADVTLAKVAKTGSIYDVAEGANANTGADKTANPQYLIFDCGSATEVI